MSRAAFASGVARSGAGSGAGSGPGSVPGWGTGWGTGSGAGRGTTHVNTPSVVAYSYGRILVLIWTHFGTHMDACWYSYGHIFVVIWTQFGTHMEAFWHSYGRILVLIWTHLSWTHGGRIMAGNIKKKSKLYRLKFSVTGGLCWWRGW